MDKKLFVFVLSCAVVFVQYCAADLPDCKKEDLHYEYTQCDSSDGRWRVSVPKEPNKCVLKPGVAEPALRGKKCDATCNNGHYLDMKTQDCKPCSPGTYSLGGGARFEEWDKLPPGFNVKTESFGSIINVKDDDEENCTNTAWMPKGSFVSSIPGECSSSLVYSANLVKPGKVKFDYQYTESNAIFHFTVKNDQCQSYSDRRGSRWPVETEEGKWGHVEVDLKTGLNVLSWKSIGVMSSSTRGSNPKAIRIKDIEISGVAFSSQCTTCRNGTYSSEGSAYCHLCKPGTYSVKGQGACTPCDAKSEYSERGASQCQKKPPCKKHDYYSFQTPCDASNKTRTKYEWIKPQICRTDISGAVNLPADDGVKDCPPCNPGMQFIKGQGCVYCADNHYSDGSKPCLPCPASTSPNYGIEYKWWNSLPQNMTSKCITFTESNCSTATSWTVSGDSIRTQFARDEGAYQVLLLKIDGFRAPAENVENVEVGQVSFVFETSCKSSCELVFLTDEGGHSNIVKEWPGTETKSLYNHNIMSPEPIILTWAFQTDNDDTDTVKDFAKIYSIRVTNTLHGGASSCQKCPKGVDEKNKACIPCPDGHYIDENTTQCMPCPKNYIVRTGNSWGIESCEECGPGLHAEKGKRCVTDCSYTDNEERKYDFAPLKSLQYITGSRLFTASGTEYYHGFNISLCGTEHTPATCVNNMTSSGGGKDSSGKVINALICRSTMVPPRNLESVVSTQPVSLGDYLTKIASNQTHDSDIYKQYQKEGFALKDVERHIHFYFKSDSKTAACPDGRSTIISLVCDAGEEDEGTIETPPKCADGTCDGCKFHFLWRNKQACPKCRIEDYEKIVGECVNGEQTIHYNAPKNCVIDGKPIKKEQKKCKLKLSALPFVLQISIPVILGLGVILLIMLVYCWHRNRKLEYKYMKLVEGSGPNYDGELPGVDSCALEDGEEEQFDSVSFKDSKSKGLFQKLRGKKKKRDDDENPFDSMHTEKMPLT